MLQTLVFAYQEMQEHVLPKMSMPDLVYLPNAVSTPAHRLQQKKHHSERPLSSGISIVTVFDDAGQKLLILGESGAGKSRLLVELAQQLAHRAEKDSSLLLPVYLPLSSWAAKRLPLRIWMREQIAQLYQVPSALVQYLIDQHQVIPLLDGLDEVERNARSA